MKSKNSFYPPSHDLKSEIYPYDNINAFKNDVESLYKSACRLKLIPDYLASEIESKLDSYFGSTSVYKRIKLADQHFEEDSIPDSLNQLYPALQDDDKEEFIYTLRGLILQYLQGTALKSNENNDDDCVIDEEFIIE